MNIDSTTDHLSDADFDFDQILLKGTVLVISFSNDLEKSLAKRWSRAMVIRLLEHKIGSLPCNQDSKICGTRQTLIFLI